ncbi:hypothetical protein [Halorarius halobius]|uniref:hypothetical protein n=1 Tax=Halorarius halobius TaxID=2962671 RepID=UPI0020CCB997|nr:hypothetical protein [Halorarius halobius]
MTTAFPHSEFYDAGRLLPHASDADDITCESNHDPAVQMLEDYIEEIDRGPGRDETTITSRRS